MTRPWLRWLANAFVIGYALDAGLSGVEEAFRATTGATWLLGPRSVLAQLVLVAALCMPLASALTPRLPTTLFLLLSASALWLNFGAAPLALIVGPELLVPVAVATQIAIALVAFAWIRLRNGGQGWLLRPASFDGRFFSPWHTAVCCAGLAIVGVPAAVLYAVLWVASSIQLETQGFVSFDTAGVSLADRRYVRADREVRLVGMMHIGEEENYREVTRSFTGADTAVLQEGVTDEQSLLRTPLSYGRVADFLGLDEQEDLASYLHDRPEEREVAGEGPPVFLHADVDVSAFAPQTVAWLERVAGLYAADDPLQALRTLSAWAAERSEDWPVLAEDLITRRNEHLLTRLDEALVEYQRIIVPWGALHLPGIESAIFQRGFERTQEARHRLLTWRGIVRRLLDTR